MEMKIMSLGACTDDGVVFWLPSMEVNGLFMMDISKGSQAVFAGRFPDCINDKAWQIKSIICSESKIHFFSHYAFEMWEMDKKERTLKHYTYFSGNTGMIDIVILAKEKIWVISRTPFRILCLNLDTKCAEQIHFEKELELQNNICISSSKWEDRIYICTRLEKDVYVGVIDALKESVRFHRLDELWLAKNVAAWNERLYISGISCDGVAVLMEYDRNGMTALARHNLDRIRLNKDTGIDYRAVLVHGPKVFFIPGIVDEFMIYDLEYNSEESILNLKIPALVEGTLPFSDIQIIENYLYLFPGLFCKIVKLNLDTLQAEMIDICAKDDDYKEIVFHPAGQMHRENVNVNLERFLEWMV